MAESFDRSDYYADDWETPRKTAKVKNKTPSAGKMVVILDLETMNVDESFKPNNLKANIIEAVERVTNQNYNITKVCAYAMNQSVEEPEQHKLHVNALKNFCRLRRFYIRNLRCNPCKTLPRGRKDILCELEIVKDLGDIVLSEKDKNAKTSFFIASNDGFFNEFLAELLVSKGFAVYTGRVKGMVRKNMFRDS